MSIAHRCDLSVKGSFNVGMSSFLPSVLPPQNWISYILNWITDPSHLPVNKGTKKCDFLGWQNTLFCMNLSTRVSTSFLSVFSLQWNAEKVCFL